MSSRGSSKQRTPRGTTSVAPLDLTVKAAAQKVSKSGSLSSRTTTSTGSTSGKKSARGSSSSRKTDNPFGGKPVSDPDKKGKAVKDKNSHGAFHVAPPAEAEAPAALVDERPSTNADELNELATLLGRRPGSSQLPAVANVPTEPSSSRVNTAAEPTKRMGTAPAAAPSAATTQPAPSLSTIERIDAETRAHAATVMQKVQRGHAGRTQSHKDLNVAVAGASTETAHADDVVGSPLGMATAVHTPSGASEASEMALGSNGEFQYIEMSLETPQTSADANWPQLPPSLVYATNGAMLRHRGDPGLCPTGSDGHIYLATTYEPYDPDALVESVGERSSGRQAATRRADTYVWVDVSRAVKAGIRFYLQAAASDTAVGWESPSAENVIMSPGNGDGRIPSECFSVLIELRDGLCSAHPLKAARLRLIESLFPGAPRPPCCISAAPHSGARRGIYTTSRGMLTSP